MEAATWSVGVKQKEAFHSPGRTAKICRSGDGLCSELNLDKSLSNEAPAAAISGCIVSRMGIDKVSIAVSLISPVALGCCTCCKRGMRSEWSSFLDHDQVLYSTVHS